MTLVLSAISLVIFYGYVRFIDIDTQLDNLKSEIVRFSDKDLADLDYKDFKVIANLFKKYNYLKGWFSVRVRFYYWHLSINLAVSMTYLYMAIATSRGIYYTLAVVHILVVYLLVMMPKERVVNMIEKHSKVLLPLAVMYLSILRGEE